MPFGSKDKNMIKARMIVLAKMFYELTDEQHPMTGLEILDYLEMQGVPANEKTLRGDIVLLQNLGLNIVKIVSRPNLYYWGNRQFEMSELKLLIDAVHSSRFITRKKSRELARKLCALSSKHQRKMLKRNTNAIGRIKPSDEGIYGTVDCINDAINRRKKIAFQYIEFSSELAPVLKNDGEIYQLSPYAMVWNDDNYYVVGWSEKHGNVSAFRMDRLENVKVLRDKAISRPKGFRLDAYSKRIFDMFDGEPEMVTMECRNDLAKYIVERFGTKMKTEPATDDTFRVTAEVSLSPTFYAWVFQFGGGIRIIGPEKAVEEMKEMAKIVLDC